MKSTRQEVFNAIDSERRYQEFRVSNESPRDRSPGEYLLYLQDYLNEAMHTEARVWGPQSVEQVMEIVRKVTALGVACLEDHGVKPRIGF